MARIKDISRDDILNCARQFMEDHGYNGFSIRDLANEVGISSASLHYYYPRKSDLVAAIIARYRDELNKCLGRIEAETDELQSRVRRLTVEINQMEPHGMTLAAVIAADFNTLPAEVQNEARQLTNNMLGWISRFVTQAKNHDELPIDSMVENIVLDIYAKLLGEALLSRLVSANLSSAVPMLRH